MIVYDIYDEVLLADDIRKCLEIHIIRYVHILQQRIVYI